jgi:hypothetical protein
VNQPIFCAGAGKAVISLPEEFFPQEHFYRIHDDIHARAIILESNIRFALISLEMTSLPQPEIEALQNIVSGYTGICKEQIWVCVTHSFSSPHFLPPAALTEEEQRKMKMLRESIYNAVLNAVKMAMVHMEPAVMGIQIGSCEVNVNRDIPTNQGWWIGSNTEGITDRSLTVIRIDSQDQRKERKTIAVIYHYSIQSSVMDGVFDSRNQRQITSDLAGYASRLTEAELGADSVALFLLGTAGDQAPIRKAKSNVVDEHGDFYEFDENEKGFEIIHDLGSILAKKILETAGEINQWQQPTLEHQIRYFSCPGQRMPKDIHSIRPAIAYTYEPEAEQGVSIEGLRIGTLFLIGVKPELNAATGLDIKSSARIGIAAVTTMVNGAAKYMADQTSYDRHTYEARNSPFAAGSAEILREQAIELLLTLEEGLNKKNVGMNDDN